ncbi:MAG: hypothetical protein QY307_01550 [Acidimicrobiia bacterium]|nr:MAG: hypothetical protein QY307_01550 [Acidimicrobiia bacterium]
MKRGAHPPADHPGEHSVDAGEASEEPTDEQPVSIHWRGGLAWQWTNVEGGTFVSYPDSAGSAG